MVAKRAKGLRGKVVSGRIMPDHASATRCGGCLGGWKMSDAPERIWVDWRPGLAVTNGPLTDVHQGRVRADLHDALARVAALTDIIDRMNCTVTLAHTLADCGNGDEWADPIQCALDDMNDALADFRALTLPDALTQKGANP